MQNLFIKNKKKTDIIPNDLIYITTPVPADVDQEHAEWVLLSEYKDKLKIDDSLQSLPDPMELKTGWLGEENGMKFWPHVYLTLHVFTEMLSIKKTCFKELMWI